MLRGPRGFRDEGNSDADGPDGALAAGSNEESGATPGSAQVEIYFHLLVKSREFN